MKQASVLLATARAHKVLPVPGGPYSKTPLGGSMPRLTKRSGWRRGVSTTCDRSSKKEEGGLYDLSQLLNLLLATSNVTVCHIWLLLNLLICTCWLIHFELQTYPFWASDLHHSDCRVDLWRQGNVDLVPGKVSSVNCISWSSIMLVFLVTHVHNLWLVNWEHLLVPVHSDPHAFLNVSGSNAVSQVNHKLGKLLHVDDVPDNFLNHLCAWALGRKNDSASLLLGVIRVSVDDLCASCDLATDCICNLHWLWTALLFNVW